MYKTVLLDLNTHSSNPLSELPLHSEKTIVIFQSKSTPGFRQSSGVFLSLVKGQTESHT